MSLSVALLAALPLPALAERLAVKTYTMADGLPRNSVNCIRRDSHGFLWFCTDEGLSRFDGYTFTNYGVEQGLPDAHVNDFLESRSGEYWVATGDGLCRFNPRPSKRSIRKNQAPGKPMFEIFRPSAGDFERNIKAIAEDRDGTLWCGTIGGGLYRFTPTDGRFDPIAIRDVTPVRRSRIVYDLLLDHQGALWIGLEGELLRRWPDGRIERYTEHEGLPGGKALGLRISDLLEDTKGRLWVATWSGLCQLVANPKPGRPAVERVYTTRDGLPDNQINSLFQSAAGILWVAARGLAEFAPEGEKWPHPFRSYMNGAWVVGEDAAGNIWTNTSRWARSGFTTYTVEDGLASNGISSIFEDQQGRLCVVTGDKWDRGGFINRLEGQRFVPVEPKVPARIFRFTWGWNKIHFQDHTGAWWIATSNGLCRYPKLRPLEDLAHTLPEAIFTAHHGLPGNDIFQLFEDSRGDVWVSVVGPDVVTRWSRADKKFSNYAQDAEGKALGMPLCFAEDRAGSVWMGFFWHGLARYRNGHFQAFTTADGLPPGVVRAIYSDHAGRLWLATSHGGLLRLDDPAATTPRFVAYTTAQGLSSNEVHCITEDAWGRIYVGTGRGVDRLDPQTGRIQRYTALAGQGLEGDPSVAFRDRQGVLWFGQASSGLARIVPGPDQVQSPPPIRITSIRLRGTRYPISELGESALAGPTLEPNQNQVELGFASLNFAVGEVIRYQYKLEGSDRDWSPLTDLRTVNYATLSPGSYRFLVRAANSEGAVSLSPAWVTFEILRPVWQRGWFLSLAVLLSAALVYAMYRYRLERLLDLERVRTRIATDLHDDIGSSLTQIAIMSEVARQQTSEWESVAYPLDPSKRLSEPLARIAELSRGLVDSMSDVVWAIDPRRDHLSDLAYRMRRFASDLFSARNIELGFSAAPSQLTDPSLGADVRREVFLIFKESVHNIVRHSKCQRVDITLLIEGSRLLLKVSDDGMGFALTEAGGDQACGRGLGSMEHRAQNLGGTLHIISEPRGGTRILLEVPLGNSPLLGRKKSLPK